ncbi:hypothetical protein, partial [Streptomyces sp. NPDC056883]|uniref:hypothetical protein n=1 Tax=Streptomyces sp. NPDC056883 TaxID=3345959 RepID=UPI0036AB4FE0
PSWPGRGAEVEEGQEELDAEFEVRAGQGRGREKRLARRDWGMLLLRGGAASPTQVTNYGTMVRTGASERAEGASSPQIATGSYYVVRGEDRFPWSRPCRLAPNCHLNCSFGTSSFL